MTILQIDTSSIPNYLTFPAHEDCRAFLLRDLEMSAAKIGLATPPTQKDGEWDLMAGMFATTCDVQFANLQLSNAKWDVLFAEGDDLDAIRQRLGLPELPATGGAGNVTVTVTGAASFLAGDECTLPGGIRAAVTTTTTFSVAGTGHVPVACVDTGSATNFTTGTAARWANPPINALTNATVQATFQGGADTESDANKRSRILDALQLPQTYGSPQWVLSQVLAFPAANYPGAVTPDQAYCFRAPGGPGTFLVVVMQTGTVANGGSRAVSDTTIAALRSYLSTLVPPETHFDIRTAHELDAPVSLEVYWTGNPAKPHWVDAIPWPALASGQMAIEFSSVSGSQILGVKATTPPPIGAKITLSGGNGLYENYTVQSYSGTAGAYTVTMTHSVNVAFGNGDYIYPQVYNPGTPVEARWMEAIGTLACGELVTSPAMPQCRRFPGVALGGASETIYGAMARWVQLLDGAAINVLLASVSYAPADSFGVWDAPIVLTAGRFALYPVRGI